MKKNLPKSKAIHVSVGVAMYQWHEEPVYYVSLDEKPWENSTDIVPICKFEKVIKIPDLNYDSEKIKLLNRHKQQLIDATQVEIKNIDEEIQSLLSITHDSGAFPNEPF